MNSSNLEQLKHQIDSIASLSMLHLSPETRQKLAENTLSVNAYPDEFGGFVFLGKPTYAIPVEPDLRRIFKLAADAGAVWLRFDAGAAVIHGLPVYGNTSRDALLAKLRQ